MKHIYLSLNYIIIDNGAIQVKYPKKDSCFSEDGSNFKIVNTCDRGETIIPFTDVPNWDDAAVGGTPYTEAGLRTFLETNTATF